MLAHIGGEITVLVTPVPQGAAASAAPVVHVRVLVPDGDNLQYLAFWVARGAGYFADEEIEPDMVVPELPAQAIAKMIAGEAPIAVLPPPVYLQLIADRFPIALVANLLQNDPIDLVVRRSVFEERRMSATAPLRDRLLSLKGLRIGVAPGPPVRLRALFASEGLDADATIQIVVRRGPEQNAAFVHGECDALYAHTPYVETALDDEDAVVLVNQSAGEAPPLAMRQIHALVARRDFLEADRPVVVAMVRAIARGEQLVHADRAAAEEAVMHALPSLDRHHVHTLVGLYQPAIPETPRVSVEGLAPALALFPSSRTAPHLDGIALGDFVAPGVLDEAMGRTVVLPSRPLAPRPARLQGALALGIAVVVALGLALWRRTRRRRAVR